MTGSLPPSDRDLAGRTIVVTGATSGIGREIALALARRGATLVPVGRDSSRTQALAAELGQLAGAPADAVVADLASIAATRAAGAAILARHPAIHVLVNNAGIWNMPRAAGPDGIELTWATNVLAPHVLTQALLPGLRAAAPARVVNVASTYAGDLDLDDVEFARRPWGGVKAYRQSKLAMRMWTWALAARLEGTGITANACHPGGIYTGIYRSPRGPLGWIIRTHARLTKGTPRDGADTPAWLAADPSVAARTGTFWEQRHEIPCPHRAPADLNRLWALLERQAARSAAAPHQP